MQEVDRELGPIDYRLRPPFIIQLGLLAINGADITPTWSVMIQWPLKQLKMPFPVHFSPVVKE